MGCDGGTIPRRDELVKTKKKPEAKDKDSELVFQWRHCAISQEPLQLPIVACGMGKLYNKLTVVESLLNRDMPASAAHIRNLKDVKTLNLTPNPSFADGDKKDGSADGRGAPFICPVIGLEMSGKHRFVALWSCGCVFSERALKEVKTQNCHKCLKPFTSLDVVVLNGTETDSVAMFDKIEQRALEVRKKKEKRSKKGIKVEIDESEAASVTTVSAVVKVDAAQVGAEKVQTIEREKRPGSLKAAAHDSKKMKLDYSVANDPQVTNVYKSLFTTHESEKKQDRAHWVTYNPFYN